ncbi:glutamate-cysteine ligase family protein [Streptomyces bauhiniae]|uniref:glutamate-cysteine ligase family protein n=1 Tax=Streptomyces bauhiniae TaxID=2340725 RepID=UPI003333EF16
MDDALSEPEATALIFDHSMYRGRVGRIGVELEWFVLPLGDASRRADSAESVRLACLLGDQLPRGSRISWEPGGQLELSGAPFDSLSDCVTAVTAGPGGGCSPTRWARP